MGNAVFHKGSGAGQALRAFACAALLAGAAGCEAKMEPLHEAAITGDAAFVKSWIERKRNLDLTYDEPSTGLEGNYARARGMTALMYAAKAGQFEIVKLLVEAGANLYAESNWRDGSHPRHAFDYAVEHAVERSGRVEVAEYLWARSDGTRFAARLDEHIAAGCRRTCNDRHGGDARGNLGLFLIGLAPDRQRGKGISEAACYAQRPMELLAFLDRHGVRFPKNTLHCAAYVSTVRSLRTPAERIAMATFFLEHGADLEDPPGGHTALMGAAATHDLEMVQFLLARGANPNARNAGGVTAIGLAANSCVFGGSDAQVEPAQKPQLAVIEHLARSGGDAKLNATAAARAQLQVLSNCCSRRPHSPTQRRICEVFGL